MNTMKAVRIHEFGGPEVLRVEDVPIPQPQGDEVLVKIHAASINPIDYKTRAGMMPSLKLPMTLGRDFSGVVESGNALAQISRGTNVFGLLGRDRGSYAEHVVAKVGEFVPKPAVLDHIQAAAVPLAALTAWQGLFDHGDLKSGQKVLIHGGGGGVGNMAIQLAKAKGAWVATTCSTADLDFVRELGADRAIDYKTQKFEAEVSDIDLVYDLIGGDTQERSFAVLKRGGALVSTLKEPDKDKAREKDLRVSHYGAVSDASELAEIGRLIDLKKVRPVVARTFKLEDAARAQTFLENEHVQGKAVLTID